MKTKKVVQELKNMSIESLLEINYLKQEILYHSKILESYGEVILELRKENNELKNRIENLEKIPSAKNEIPKKNVIQEKINNYVEEYIRADWQKLIIKEKLTKEEAIIIRELVKMIDFLTKDELTEYLQLKKNGK